jgi:hypothetical protein
MAHGRTTTAKATDRAMTAAERQAYALRLRRDGATYDDIARVVGYADKASAYKAIRSALAEITREPAAEVKALELARLDALYASAMAIVDAAPVIPDDEDEDADPDEAYDAAMKTRLDAIRTALKVSERRSKLEGLDAPIKTQDVSPYDGMSREELEAKAAEVAQRLAAAKEAK